MFTDLGRTYSVALSNGALIHADKKAGSPQAPLVVTLTKPELLLVLAKGPAAVAHTGDLGQLREGYMFYHGRADDLIKSRGK